MTYMEPQIVAADPSRIVCNTSELLRELRAARDEIAECVHDDGRLAAITPLHQARLCI